MQEESGIALQRNDYEEAIRLSEEEERKWRKAEHEEIEVSTKPNLLNSSQKAIKESLKDDSMYQMALEREKAELEHAIALSLALEVTSLLW